MPKDPEPANYDYNAQLAAQLAEAIKLLADRVAPKAVHPKAQEAIDKHAALIRRMPFVFRETPEPSTKY